MTEQSSGEKLAKAEDLNVFLEKARVEFDIAKGVKREKGVYKDVSGNQEERVLEVKRPGYDEKHPDEYILWIRTPRSIREPKTTGLCRKWRANDRGYLQDHIHEVVFSTKPNIIGGNPKTEIAQSSDITIGTWTFYADSDTKPYWNKDLPNPLQTAKDILQKLRSAPVPQK